MDKKGSVILLEIIFEDNIFGIIFSEKKHLFYIYIYNISIDTKQEQQGTYKKTNECIHDFQ